MIRCILLASVMLSGCNAVIPTYTNEQLQTGSLAKIVTKKRSFFYEDWKYYIHEVYQLSGEPVLKPGFNGPRGRNELYLPAGTYRIVLICSKGMGSAEPEMIVQLKAGKMYLAECVSVDKAENIFGVKAIDILGAEIIEIESEDEV